MKQTTTFGRESFRFRKFVRKAYSAFNSMSRVVNIGVLTSCILTTASLLDVTAQTTEKEVKIPEMEELELEEVMVMASKVEIPINRTAKLVTILSKEEIKQAPIQSIQDLLVYAANIDVQQRAGHGVQADISLRGGTKDQTAILLNGINLSNAHTGVYNLDLPINISDIERIEIIHGPAALIYGAGAFAGGVNIITKKRPDSKAYIRLESGMHNLWGFEARGAITTGIASSSLSLGRNISDGYASNTDYKINNALAQTRLKFKDYSNLDINIGYNEKKYGANSFYTAAFPNQYDHTTRYMSTLKGEFGNKLKVIPILYWFKHFDVFELRRGLDKGRNYHKADTYGSNLIFQYTSQWGTSSIGSEIRRDEIMSSVIGRPMSTPHGSNGKYKNYDSRTNYSLTVEHTAVIDKFVISAGGLINYNTLQSGKYKFLPSLGINYSLNDAFSLYSTWTSSTHMPTFTELLYTSETHAANQHLKPEQSQSVDLGLKYKNAFFSAYLTAFAMKGKNIIDWVREETEDGKWINASWNHPKVNTQGVEAGISVHLQQWIPILGAGSQLGLDYARLNKDGIAGGQIYKYAQNYLRDKFTARLTHMLYNNISIGWYFRYQYRMGMYDAYENALEAGRAPYKPFSTLDIKVNYIYNKLQLHVNMNNIYNTRHNDMGNIPQPGFWLTGGVSYLW